jgi:Tfp pilus assembly protein PilF
VIATGILYFVAHLNPTAEGDGEKRVTLAVQYVGSSACVSCHATEGSAWLTSQHHDAMAQADEHSVLGNFNNARFTYAGLTSTFFKRDGKFFVNTEGRDGKLTDYEIKYTFGVSPLQQYLIEFPDGRLQALSIAWDSRPKKNSGQRWFHLYPKERITHGDELHWTGPAQNWNFMCADCHSTELRKNYDPATDRFQTQWAEINVGCEACHGPGSNHVVWAKSQHPLSKGEVSSNGLTVRLDERRGVAWTRSSTDSNPVRSRARSTEREIEVCAQCHARRGQIFEGYTPGKPFLDYYRPALLRRPLYYVDGQQRDEVYIWGSFLQSKMYANGVTCSDCHNPHSGKLRAEGNSLCATCHLGAKYDTPAHHHHKPDSAGAACVACHMPTTTYMVIDPRHDHSLRVPRPDLSVTLSTPNACNSCHNERDARWAATQVKHWYGRDPQGYQRFAAAFAAADAAAPEAQAQLRAIAADTGNPAIARATALVELGSIGPAALDAMTAGLRDPSPLVRLAALQSLGGAPPDARLRLAAPLLADSLRAIRIEAANLLAGVPADQLSVEQRSALERAAQEYVASQRYNADRAEGRVNLGNFYARRGDAENAVTELKAAIKLNPNFIPAYANLADLYRVLGRDTEGESVLREGLKIAPKNAILHHSLGLALVRMKRRDAALAELEQATILDPENARFSYVYAVALHSAGKSDEAIARLKKNLADHPNNRDVLAALVSFYRARGQGAEAKKYADRLKTSTDNGQER